jgi:signal transduction histidine kinase
VTRRLLASYLSITLFALAVLVYPLGRTFAALQRDRLVFDVERDATVFASLSEDALESGSVIEIDSALAAYTGTAGGRVVIVDTGGISLVDTDAPDGPRRDFSSRPEIVAALDGQRTDGTRYSETLGGELIYVAVPVASGGVVHGAVRITVPTSTLVERINGVWIRLGLLSAVVLTAVAGVGFLLARGVTRPVRTLIAGAEQLAEGRLDQRVPTDIGAPELRLLASTFNETANRLERLVESQRAFVADASHQLRTPLTALRLRLENLESHLGASEQQRLAAGIAELDRLSHLVDGLLALARTTETQPDRVRVDVDEVLAGRADQWHPASEAAGVELRFCAPTGLEVWAVPGALEQALDNLIDNAVGTSPPGTEVAVTAWQAPGGDRDSGHVEIHVIDGGPGMSAEQRARAFDRFWRDPSTTRPGSGLGLAIVDDLITASGGVARLEPAASGGLDACLVLQPARPAPGAIASRATSPDP